MTRKSRHRPIQWIGIVSLALALSLTIHGQQSATATISGVVVGTGNGAEPIRRAIVTVGPRYQSVTDDEGLFALRDLPAGSYVVKVSKPAFVSTELGATRTGGPGTPIVLAEGQRLEGVTIRMMRGAAITGTLVDIDGEPAANVRVGLSNFPAREALTDDRGAYRIYGLPPGEYTVRATPPPGFESNGGLASIPPAQIDAALSDLRSRTAPAPGSSRSATPVAVAALAPRAAPRVSYAPVFYPGTASPSDAVKVRVAEAEERTGVDFALILAGALSISGRVTTADGSPASGVTVMAAQPGTRGSRSSTTGGGEFTISNLPPDRYVITARSNAISSGLTGPDSTMPVLERLRTRAWAMTEVDATTGDVNNVHLQLGPALTMTGRVRFDRTVAALPRDLTTVQLTIETAGLAGTFPRAQADVTADGDFELRGLVPGTYRLSGAVPSIAGWWLRSILLDGRDLLDTSLEIAGRHTPLAGAVATFTDRRTELAGTLQTSAGRPASEYVVIVFPADRGLWSSARRVRSTRPATSGRFEFADLPPGAYRLAAVTDLDPARLQTPEFLEQCEAVSVPIRIDDDGGRHTQDLRIAR